jgi:DNA-binding MarR family transcriptional regulator
MTPKDKAKDLVSKMYIEYKPSEDDASGVYVFYMNLEIAKRCALITVDEILDLGLHDVGDYRNDQSTLEDFSTVTWYINYWNEVKQEIQLL